MNSITAALDINQRGVISFVGAGGKTTLMFRMAKELAKKNSRVLVTTTTKMFTPGREQSREILITGSHQELLNQVGPAFRHSSLLFSAASEDKGTKKVTGFSTTCINTLWQSGCFEWILVEADGSAQKPIKAPADHEPAVPTSTTYLLGLIGLSAFGQPLNNQHIHRLDAFLKIADSVNRKVLDMAAMVSLIKHPEGLFKNCPTGGRKIAFMNQADTLKDINQIKYLKQQMQQHPQNMPDLVAIGQASEARAVLKIYSKPQASR